MERRLERAIDRVAQLMQNELLFDIQMKTALCGHLIRLILMLHFPNSAIIALMQTEYTSLSPCMCTGIQP